MRKIKFRGKNAEDGEWIYGYYIKYKKGYFIFPEIKERTMFINNFYSVIPETIGELVGIIYGEEIYTGDIVKTKANGKIWIIKHDGALNYIVDNKDIKNEGNNKFAGDEKYYLQEYFIMTRKAGTIFEKIGNIHDNPEYLKKKDQQRQGNDYISIDETTQITVETIERLKQRINKEKNKEWYCNHCKCVVPPHHVTFEETHDELCGGCGYPVGDREVDKQ